MHLFMPLKQLFVLFPLILIVFVRISTSVLVERGSGTSCCIGSCDDDDNGNENVISDGAIADGSGAAGIGIEFETTEIRFGSVTANEAATDSLKGKLVGPRQGTN